MFWIVCTIFVMLVTLATFKLRVREAPKESYSDIEFATSGDGFRFMLLLPVLWLLISIPFMMFSIKEGHIGLIRTFKEYTGQAGPGFHFKAPWQGVDEVNGRVQKATIPMNGGKEGSAVSSETQPVYADLGLNYQVKLEDATELYSEVGPAYFEAIVEPRVQQAFKSVTVEYKTEAIAPAREEIRAKASKILTEQLEPFGIRVQDLLISNLSFSKEFLAAIEDKQVATQEAKAAQERVAKVKAEAQQKIEQARGEAEALRVKGEQLRKSPEIVQLEAIEKLNPNAQIVYLPSEANILLGEQLLGKSTNK